MKNKENKTKKKGKNKTKENCTIASLSSNNKSNAISMANNITVFT